MKRLLLLSLLLSVSNLFAQGYVETQKIIASDSGTPFQFGSDVAIQGDIAVVGSLNANYQNTGPLGVAYIFKKSNSGIWEEQQLLVAPDRAQYDKYGEAVAIDNDYIIVGAKGQRFDAVGAKENSQAVAVYIYKNDGNYNWVLEQKITATDREYNTWFGADVAIDDNRIVVGCIRKSYDANGQNFKQFAGAAYIFEKDVNNVWNQVAKVVAPDRETQDNFGNAVSINGNYASVGAYLEGEDENGNNTISEAGSVYVFKRDTNGSWSFQQKLVPTERPNNSERLGSALDMDGDYIVAGAPYADEPNLSNGAVYIFKRDINDTWSQVDKIIAPDGILGEWFGNDVAIQGNRILVGSSTDYLTTNNIQNKHGSLYYYVKDATTDTWVYQNKTLASNWQDTEAHNFGCSVDLDGDNAIVGDWISDEQDPITSDVYSEAGAAFLLEFDPTLPVLSANGIDDISVNVYPNPVQDYININFKEHYEEVKITIYDMLGKLVLSKKYNSSSDLSLPFHVEKGLYMVKIQSKNNEESTLKIVKQ